MEIGKLKDRIELYTVSTTADGEGGMTDPVYTLVYTKFANVRELSESEALRSGLSMAERNIEFTFHRNIGELISRSMLLVYSDRRFNITAVTTDDSWFYVTASEMDRYPEGGFDPGPGADMYHLTNVSQLTIINGDALPPGIEPDNLFIDTGFSADYNSGEPLIIVKPEGYVFKKCLLDTGKYELLDFVVKDAEADITTQGNFNGKRVIYQSTPDAIIDGNFVITCTRQTGEEESDPWRAVLKFEKSLI